MFWSLSLVAVREQKHQRRRDAPFCPAGGNELVENHLGAIDEVAILALPDDESLRFLDVVAEFETDRGIFGQRAVVDLERRARLRKLLQRNESFPGTCIVKYRVTMAEGTALDVFAGHAYRNSISQD